MVKLTLWGLYLVNSWRTLIRETVITMENLGTVIRETVS